MTSNWKKRAFSLLLSFALLLGNFPAVAYAAAEDGLCEHHDAHTDCGYEEGVSDCDYHCAVCEVVTLIDALPALEEIQVKPMEEQGEDYTQVNAAYDAYMALSDDQKALLTYGHEFFEPYLAYFSGQTQETATNHSHPVCGTTCRCADSHYSSNWTAWDGTTKLYNGDYYLTRNIVLDSTMVLDYNYSTRLCLNGYSITCADTVFDIYSYRSLLITDCTGRGKIETTASWPTIGNNKYLSVWGGTILNSADYGYAVECYSGTTTYVCGGKIESKNSAAIFAHPGSTISIQGGTVCGNQTAIDSNGGTGGVSNLSISGGRITSNDQYSTTVSFTGSLTMTGGYVDGDVWSGDNGTSSAISGGTIDGVLVDAGDSLTITGGTLGVGLESKKTTISAGTFKGSCYFGGTGSTTITGGNFSECEILEVYNETWISGGSYSTIRVWGGKLYLSGVPEIKLLQVGTPSSISAQNIDGTGSFGGDRIEVSFTNPYSSYVWKDGDVVIKNVKSDAVAEKFTLAENSAEWMCMERFGDNMVVRVWPHGNCEGNVNWRLENGTLIVSGSGAIPDYAGPYSSSGTRAPWFDIKAQIKEVYIESGITTVGENAFNQCLNLKQVTLPEGITLNKYAFYETGLTSVTLPENTVLAGRDSIFGNSPITSITIPGSTVLTPYGFSYCKNVTELTIGEGLTEIPYATFMRCEALEKVTIPASVNQVGDWAFENCLHLKEVIFAGNAPTFGSNVFREATMIAYYPAGDETWTQDKLQNYGGSITWIATCGNHSYEGAEPEYSWSEDYSKCTAYLNCINDGCQVKQSETVNSTVATDEATCTEDGQTTYTAIFTSTIFETQTKEIAIPGGHSFVEGACENCGAKENPCAEGHEWKDATCTVPKTCSVCGTTEGDPLGHTCEKEVADAKYLKKAGTCQTAAVYYKSCECGEPGDDVFTGALGNHSFSEGVCTVCDAPGGYCGDLLENNGQSMTWTWNAETKTLTISGNGTMEDYDLQTAAPWHALKTDIEHVIITEGISSIGDSAFRDCVNLSNIDLPDSLTEIGLLAFHNATALATITLPENLSVLGMSAFGGAGLVEITIPSGLKVIDQGVFSGCTSLETAVIPGNVKEILKGAFFGCSNLETLTLNEGLKIIGDEVFYNCDKLTEISIPNSVTEIRGCAFQDCDGLTSVDISENVTYIGEMAFMECDNLTDIWVDEENSNYSSDDSGVLFDKEKTTLIQMPGGKKGSYTVPAGVTVLGGYSFYECKLDVLTLSDSVTSIGMGAFSSSALKYVVIPSGLRNVGEFAFYGCSALWHILYAGTETQWESITVGEENDPWYRVTRHYQATGNEITSSSQETCTQRGLYECTICNAVCWIDKEEASHDFNQKNIDRKYLKSNATCSFPAVYYMSCECGAIGEDTFTDGEINHDAHVFEDGACKYCGNVGGQCGEQAWWTLDDEGNLTVYGSGAVSSDAATPWSVYHWDKIKSAVVREGITDITASAFSGCQYLQSVTIPSTITYLDTGMFGGCGNLTDIYIADIAVWLNYSDDYWSYGHPVMQCNELQKNLYLDGELITELEIPDGATRINAGAFSNCINLQSVTIGNDVEMIAQQAFAGCSNLKAVTILDGVTKIDSAFMNCTALETVTIPNSVTEIGSSAFYGCSSLQTVNLPDDLDCISDHLFSKCVNLQSVAIPDTISSIGEYAFYECSSLESIYIPSGVTEIGEGAFYGCRNLVDVYITDIASWVSLACGDEDGHPLGMNSESGPIPSAKKLYLNGELIKDVVIPEGITAVAPYSFYGCAQLESITVPESLTDFGLKAFYGCYNLTDVYIADLASWITISSEEAYDHPFYYAEKQNKLYLNEKLVTKAVIPEGITDVGFSAFAGCSDITEVSLPEGLVNIGNYAFKNCDGLTHVTIPCSVKRIGGYSFADCDGLTTIDLGEGVTEIWTSAFAGCEKLTAITIPETVTEIGDGAFSTCTELTSAIIPDGIAKIGGGLFSGCSSLEDVYFGGSMEDWKASDYAVHEEARIHPLCTDAAEHWEVKVVNATCTTAGSTSETCSCGYIRNEVPIPATGEHTRSENHRCTICGHIGGSCGENLTWVLDEKTWTLTISGSGEMDGYDTVSNSAPWYSYRNSIEAVVINEGVTTVGSSAFKDCSALERVEIPEGVTALGYAAFENCVVLSDITIPSSVTKIGYLAFSRCLELTSITIPDGVEELEEWVFFGCDSLTGVVIPDGVKRIGEHAFYQCTSLDSVVLPYSVQEIGANAFYECSSLTSIEIPEGIIKVNDYTFSGCAGLTSVTLPETLTGIGILAFSGCNSLTEITLPNNVTSIGDSAFSGCNMLSTIRLPEKLKTIGEGAFGGCAMTEIDIPDGVTYIGSSAFSGCTNLKSVVIPNGVTFIYHYTFRNCSSLNQIVLPEGLTGIGNHAFYSCSSLTRIDIPDSVESIGEYAFFGCSGITAIAIPDGVTDIYPETFNCCTALKSVYIPDSVVNIHRNAFQYCNSLEKIVIPENVEEIGTRTFWGCPNLRTVKFMGDAPSFSENVFLDTTTTVYYPQNNDTWIESVRLDYGGTVTWEAYCAQHSYSAVVTEPTCTEKGYTTHTCACGDSYVDSEKEPLKHDMGEWKVTKDPTCTAEGKKTRSCKREGCNHTETEKVGAKGHSHTSVVTAPTCTEKGYTTHTCACGDSYVDSEKEPLKHDMGEWKVTKDPTCTAEGKKTRSCKREGCNHTETEKVGAKGHSHTSVVTEPTCTEKGYTTHTCAVCGDSYVDSEKSALGHDMGEWKLVQDITCTEDGSKRRDCSRCDYYETGVIESKGHSYTIVVTAPTCTEKGYITHTCSLCGDSYEDTHVDALDHEMGQWTVVTEATPTAKGEEQRKCSVCGHSETREVEYKGNVLAIPSTDLLNMSAVWIDGALCEVVQNGDTCHIVLPEGDVTNMVSYSYNVGDPEDIHTQYPTGMRVWRLAKNEDGTYTANYVKELDNILQYSGSSIRITGKKGIRMITSITKDNKTALTGKGLAGYKLLEYGTALCWAKDLEGGKSMVLGQSYVKSNYAYKRGVADPVFAYSGNLVQYTNVLVGFSLDQCKDDIAMRPYITLEDANGEQITIYGGIVYRSIGYIAYQNRNVFKPGNASYDYVWEIIHHVYGKKYDADYKG